MKLDFEKRLLKAREYCARHFYHDDFKAPKKVSEFIKCQPKLGSSILSQEEELFYFKKMNYFKYKAKKLLDSSSPTERRLSKAESLVVEAKKVRNIIAERNFRLANQLLKYNVSFYRNNSLLDSLISDAYFDILKSVDYFNWTLGNRFSTYATWVIKKNFFRECKETQKKSKKTINIEDLGVKLESSTPYAEGFLKADLDYKSHKNIVSSLLSMLESGDCAKDTKRQVFILESYFGLNGKDSHTLEQISGELGVTKERVRQLKEKGLTWLREELKRLNLEYDVMFDSVRY